MDRRLILALLLVAALFQTGATCNGTETGNPTQAGEQSGTAYSNPESGVALERDSGWNVAEVSAPSPISGGECPGCQVSSDEASGIDASTSPSTVFSDVQTSVTLYYVTLSSTPLNLQSFLFAAFPSRNPDSFVPITNSEGLSGFVYDNPEPSSDGGDLREYYFLNDTLLLYIVAELFEDDHGLDEFEILLDSLHFDR